MDVQVNNEKSFVDISNIIVENDNINDFLNKNSNKNLKKFENSRFYSIYELFSNIGYTLYEKIFPRHYEKLNETEERVYKPLKTKLFRYFIKINQDTDIWTTSTVPKDIMEKFKNNQLSNEIIQNYNLDKIPALLIHGFCAGSGFWSMNIDDICDTGCALFAIDMPGFGHSSRINFPIEPDSTENVFIESFELWRQKIGLNKLIIIGHSLGGFLTSAYALKYPQNVEHAVLVDAWGFPDLKETVTNVMKNETTTIVGQRLASKQGWFRVIVFLLKPFTPLSVVRLFGSIFGPKLISKARPQFAQQFARVYGKDNSSVINDYIYCINAFKATGETAFRSLAHPLGWARNPMLPRIYKLESTVPITFVYGSHSWISSETGYDIKQLLKRNTIKVYVIENAGHHLYADQPEIFGRILNKVILKHNPMLKNENLLLLDEYLSSASSVSVASLNTDIDDNLSINSLDDSFNGFISD